MAYSDIFARDNTDPVAHSTRDLSDYQVAIAPFAIIINNDLRVSGTRG